MDRPEIHVSGCTAGVLVSRYHRIVNDHTFAVRAWAVNGMYGEICTSIRTPGTALEVSNRFVTEPCSRTPDTILTMVATKTVSTNQSIVLYAQGAFAQSLITTSLTITVTIRLIGGTVAVQESKNYSCLPSQDYEKQCRMNIDVPQEWMQIGANGLLRGTAIIVSTSANNRDVTIPIEHNLASSQPVTASSGVLTAQMPIIPVELDEVFEIPIYANTTDQLASVILNVMFDVSVYNVAVAVAETGHWSGSIAVEIPRLVIALARGVQSPGASPQLELIATIIGHVKPNATKEDQTVQLSLRSSSNADGRSVLRNNIHVHSTNGISHNGFGLIPVNVPRIVHMLIHIEQRELFNTAVLNGQIVALEYFVCGVMSDGSIERLSTSRLSCKSGDSNVIQANCTHLYFTGVETSGSTDTTLTVIDSFSGYLAVQQLVVRYPYNEAQVVLQARQLRPIAGWSTWNNSCAHSRPRYQETRFGVLATFGTSQLDDSAISIDVSFLVRNQISLESEDVAILFKSDALIRGISEGTAVLRITNARQEQIGWSRIQVGGSSVSVKTISVTAITSINHNQTSICSTDTSESTSMREVDIFIRENVFTRHNQSAVVMVIAWLSDGSSILLEPSDGVVLSSTRPDAIRIVADKASWRAIVPTGAMSILEPTQIVASWLDECASGNHEVTGSVNVSVHLDEPIAISVHVHGDLRHNASRGELVSPPDIELVSPQDASRLLGFASSATFDVRLHYADRTVVITHDPRLTYNNSVSSDYLRILPGQVEAIDAWPTNTTGLLTITYTGDIILRTRVPVSLCMSQVLSLTSTVIGNQLGTVGTSDDGRPIFDSLQLGLLLQMSNGKTLAVPDPYGSFSMLHSSEVFSFHDSLGIVFIAESGIHEFRGFFLGMSTEPLIINVVEDAVYVTRILSFSFIQDGVSINTSNAFRGPPNVTTGQLVLRVELSSGVVLANFFDNNTAYANLVHIEVNKQGSFLEPIDVNERSGVVTLKGNAPAASVITVFASSKEGSIKRRQVRFHANLDFDHIGDLDLGAPNGIALRRRRLGAAFDVPLRVETGGARLSAFEFRLRFDSEILEIENPLQDIRMDSSGASGLLYSELHGNELRVLGTVTQWFSSNESTLLTIRFRAVGLGVSYLTGRVDVLESPTMSILGGAQTLIVAGHMYQEVFADDELRGRRQVSPLNSEFGFRAQSIVPCEQTGDVNGDCSVDVADVLFLIQYLAYREMNFSGEVGHRLQSLIAANPYVTVNLDADYNGDVDGRDVLYLFAVAYGGLSHLVDVGVSPVSPSSDCLVTLESTFSTPNLWLQFETMQTVFFVLTHEDLSFALSFDNAVRTVQGQYIEQPGGVSAVVIRAIHQNASEGQSTYSASLAVSSLHSFPQIGVSVVQVVRGANGEVRHSVMTKTGKTGSDRVQISLPVHSLELPALETLTIASIQRDSWPLAEYTNNHDSLFCNALQSNCSVETSLTPATIFGPAVCPGTSLNERTACTGRALGALVVENTRLFAEDLSSLVGPLELAALHKGRQILHSASNPINLTCVSMSIDDTRLMFILHVQEVQPWSEAWCLQSALVLRLLAESDELEFTAHGLRMVPSTFTSASCTGVKPTGSIELDSCPGLLFGYLELNESSSAVLRTTSLDAEETLLRLNRLLDTLRAKFTATCITILTPSLLRIGYGLNQDANCGAAAAIVQGVVNSTGGLSIATKSNVDIVVNEFTAVPCADKNTTTTIPTMTVHETNVTASTSGQHRPSQIALGVVYASVAIVVLCLILLLVLLSRRALSPSHQESVVDRLLEHGQLDTKEPPKLSTGFAVTSTQQSVLQVESSRREYKEHIQPNDTLLSPQRFENNVKWDLDGRSLPALSRSSTNYQSSPSSRTSHRLESSPAYADMPWTEEDYSIDDSEPSPTKHLAVLKAIAELADDLGDHEIKNSSWTPGLRQVSRSQGGGHSVSSIARMAHFDTDRPIRTHNSKLSPNLFGDHIIPSLRGTDADHTYETAAHPGEL